MAYVPDIKRYQQLVYGGTTGKYDCTAWGGALVADAHTQGAIKLSGRAIRLASNEPVPDSTSPGLNVQQVDDAIYKLTDGKVNLWTPDPRSIGRAGVRSQILDGRYGHVAVKRSVLVDRGYGGTSGFRGSHDIVLRIRLTDLAPIIGDPLVPYWFSATWDAVLDAMQAVTASGYMFCSFSRDLTADYRVSIQPKAGTSTKRFYKYRVDGNGKITGRAWGYTDGFKADCTPPRTHTGVYTRELVQITSGVRKGQWVNAVYASRV